MKEGISRQQLLRIRKGEARPTDRKIFILVAAIREMTGYAVRASDLFHLEPAMAEGCLTSIRYPRQVLGGSPCHSRSLQPANRNSRRSTSNTAFCCVPSRCAGTTSPPDDAEALVHDTFIAYLERHTVIRELKPWPMGAVSNSCKHYWRDLKREAPMPETVFPGDENA